MKKQEPLTDYRMLMKSLVECVLDFSGFKFKDDWCLCDKTDSFALRMNGKYLYVPEDGTDFYKFNHHTQIECFDPFRLKEHMLLLANVLTTQISNSLRDEDDIDPTTGLPERLEDGSVKSIVDLVKRGRNESDQLPIEFNGCIYEMWLRQGTTEFEILGTMIHHEGDEIMCIFLLMLSVIQSLHPGAMLPDPNKIVAYVKRVMLIKDKEFDKAKGSTIVTATNALSAIDTADLIARDYQGTLMTDTGTEEDDTVADKYEGFEDEFDDPFGGIDMI